MNKKKIIILTILFVAIAGLTLSPASAATKTYKTGKLYFKYNGNGEVQFPQFSKSIDSKSELFGYYIPSNYKKYSQNGKNYMSVGTQGKISKSGQQYNPNYKPSKIKVMFKKTVKGKTYYSSKTFANIDSDLCYSHSVNYKPKNNYNPHYAIIYYKKI